MAWLSDRMTAGDMVGQLAAAVAPSFEVVREVAPVRQQVLQNLRRAIFEGRFRAGDRLVERELCDLTGVSRTSVREALRQLESEGLVVNLPNRGPVVRTITAAEAQDLYQVRALLEGLAGRLFAERASTDQIDQLRQALEDFEAAVLGAGDTGIVVRGADRPFYEVMLRGCGNQTAHSVLRSLHDRILLLRATTLSQPGRAADTVAELRRILDAIERRDPQAAWQACVDHVQRAADVAVRALGNDQDGNAREG
jgi:DNA-binding GntR family transcriptional regulator